MKRLFLTAVLAALSVPAANADLAGPKEIPVHKPVPPAPIGPFTIGLGEALTVPVNAGIAGVSVGSPYIANVAVHDKHLLLLSGRAYGRTTLHVIDDRGVVVADTYVQVVNTSATELVVTRGGADETYDCAPRCRVAPTIGDDTEYFTIATEQAATLAGNQ